MTRGDDSGYGGKTWAEAKLIGEPIKYASRFWEYEWRIPGEPGRHIVMARPTDDRGRIRSKKRHDDRRNAVISHVLPIEVEVR